MQHLLRMMSGLCLVAGLSANVRGGDIAQFPVEQVDFFERKIRPVLIAHCYECHSSESKTLQAALRVDTRPGLLSGGDSGPSIVPGNPEESLLLQTMRYTGDSYDMPPKGKLPDHIIADFEKWIAMGAPDPRNAETAGLARTGPDLELGKQFWSLQGPKRSSPPTVLNNAWPRRKIDFFVLARLEETGLTPAPEADRRTLIRRAFMDLNGLPPTGEEIEQFLGDLDPQAYDHLIDRLLASPHYGERWARHWLDVVRYGEDNVNMGDYNGPYKNAYRYRDWVIRAINEDLPYDEFIRRQLAIDLYPDANLEDLPALGMIGLSPQNHKDLDLAQIALESIQTDEWEDQVDLIGRGLLGLTLACARCHDHKYDPITAKDYYALAGVFASVWQTTRDLLPEEDVARSQPARDEAEKLNKEIQNHRREIAGLRKAPPASEEDSAVHQQKLQALESSIAELAMRIKELEQNTPNFVLPQADAVAEVQVRFEKANANSQRFDFHPNTPRDLPVMIRGNVANPGEIVPRRFLEVLCDGKPQPFLEGSGRKELAEAIVSPENPLTARVFVNRVWMQHFGVGLVDTPSNFGATGNPPSHPELLDDIAVRFMQSGWSLKWLHREIMLSATYRQSSRVVATPVAQKIDPGNRLLWHFHCRRLDAESLHDALLAVGGNLDLTPGGPSSCIDNPDFNRRAVYAKISRDAPSAYLQVYDFPDPTIHSEQRSFTTTPLQQLFVLNSPFVKQQAFRLAERIPPAGLPERIQHAYRLLFGRAATESEIVSGMQFLETAGDSPSTWTQYCQALLCSNEFLFID